MLRVIFGGGSKTRRVDQICVVVFEDDHIFAGLSKRVLGILAPAARRCKSLDPNASHALKSRVTTTGLIVNVWHMDFVSAKSCSI